MEFVDLLTGICLSVSFCSVQIQAGTFARAAAATTPMELRVQKPQLVVTLAGSPQPLPAQGES